MSYYWFNRQEILQKAKERYSKEKAAEYYLQNKEAIKEKSKNQYNLLQLIIRVNKKEIHKCKQPVNLDLTNVDQIVVPDKSKYSHDGFRHFIGYKEGKIDKPLCIILPQITGCIKYFKNGGKNMSFIIKDEAVLDKYSEIWDKIKET